MSRVSPSPDARLTRYAVLAAYFVALAQDPASRDKAPRILIARYFEPDERLACGKKGVRPLECRSRLGPGGAPAIFVGRLRGGNGETGQGALLRTPRPV